MIDPVTAAPNDRGNRLLVAGGWLALFAAGVFAYWPGLSGPFLLDDLGSIAALGDRGGVHDWETFRAFVFGGGAGPLGRPVALLSFLIDSTHWPADPWPFKRTNLLIHLINGGLIGLLTMQVLRLLEFGRQDARWIALLTTACWLLHPFLVSTTLYTVQRMAQLSALFVFAGLSAHLYGRSFLATRPLKAYLIMSASIGLFTLLAMFSKENGILLPTLIGVLEITIVASQQSRLASLHRYWSLLFIVVPTTFVALYLGERVLRDDFFSVVAPRDFSIYERFLTQPRVLLDYLRHWFVPELYTSGVFQDHFLKSTGILSPATTLIAILINIALISVSLIKRREWPLFAFAVLYFYAGHVLESSVLNLELYFEHRNYMTAAFLALPLAAALRKWVSHRKFLAVAVAVSLLLGSFTHYSATVWQSFASIVEVSAHKEPNSSRAQSQYATQLIDAGRHEEALKVIDRAVRNIASDNPRLLVNRVLIRCKTGTLSASAFAEDANVISKSIYDARSFKMYMSMTEAVIKGKCPQLTLLALRSMFEDMLEVAVNADPANLSYAQLNYFVGLASVFADEPGRGVAAFEDSLRSRPGASHAMKMAAHLATRNYFDEALYFSDMALAQLKSRQATTLQGDRVTAEDIHAFQAVVRADRDALRNDGSSATDD